VTEPEDASVRTVAVAVAANLVTAVAKGVAAILTGSAAMTAETAHSVADTFNEVLLYVGVRHGARHADDRHPFGYGQARYFWSLMAAVGIFVVGGLFAIADGVQTLRHPEPVTDVPVGVAVLLLVSAALEGLSWRTARRQLCARPVSATSTSASISPPRRAVAHGGVPGGFGRTHRPGPGPGGAAAPHHHGIGGVGRCVVAVTEEASGSSARASSPWKRVKWPRTSLGTAGSVNGSELPLVDSRKSDQVDAGEWTVNLLHPAATDEVAEVDGEEACVLEQRDHCGLRIDVVAGDKDHSLAPSLMRICAEDRSAERVRGLDDARTADEAGDTLA
jgi:hypothetical protein